MFRNQNQNLLQSLNNSNEHCIPPLTKTKFYEFGVELALGRDNLMARKEKWVLRDEHKDETMDYQVYISVRTRPTIFSWLTAISSWKNSLQFDL